MMFCSVKLLSNFSSIRVFPIMRHYTSRRALLYVPGDDLKKLTKSFGLDVDCIAMDCEDGVALNRKHEARSTIREILDKSKPHKDRNYDLGVRINPVNCAFFKDDLESILCANTLPDTILLPKVNSPNDLKLFEEEFKKYENSEKSTTNLIIYIESALAMINLVQICHTASSLSRNIKPVALVFGSDDFCANIGATRTEESTEILYARQKLVLVAKAFNFQAIDMVYIKFKDLEGLKEQSQQGAQMGYTGKQVIHPGQVSIVQEAFLPSKTQIVWASGLLQAFKKHQTSGKGAFTYKGNMIDMPTMRQAQNVIDLANHTQNTDEN